MSHAAVCECCVGLLLTSSTSLSLFLSLSLSLSLGLSEETDYSSSRVWSTWVQCSERQNGPASNLSVSSASPASPAPAPLWFCLAHHTHPYHWWHTRLILTVYYSVSWVYYNKLPVFILAFRVLSYSFVETRSQVMTQYKQRTDQAWTNQRSDICVVSSACSLLGEFRKFCPSEGVKISVLVTWNAVCMWARGQRKCLFC